MQTATSQCYTELHGATPPTWLTDASIRAMCERLVDDFPSCRFAGFQDGSVMKARTRTGDKPNVSDSILTSVQQFTDLQGVSTVLLPLNFHITHWCCIIVKVNTKNTFFYDPLNQTGYRKAVKTIATYRKNRTLNLYDVVAQNNPIQFDAFSCEVYVCWTLFRPVIPGPPLDMSFHSLPMRRFEPFYNILMGSLLSLIAHGSQEDDGTEDKPPAPLEYQDDADTQVAH